ncbi:MAG TPA: PEGA domain-containing protein, partial [Polyangia bacterium]
PFGDVPDAALAYFVDWSLERNGSLALRRGPAAVSFSAVRMAAPRRRRRRPPAWLPFVVGLATGGLGIAALIHATREIDRALDHHGVVDHHVTLAPTSTPTPTPTPTLARTPTPTITAPADDGDVPLSIAAEPGASVTVDGRRVGHTPLSVRVTRGAHVVELARPRYQTARLDVDAPGRAHARLERPRATLHVTSSFADAEVLVDGDDMGKAPVSAEVAGYERCKVEVRAADGRTWRKRIYVRPPLTDLAAIFAAE